MGNSVGHPPDCQCAPCVRSASITENARRARMQLFPQQGVPAADAMRQINLDGEALDEELGRLQTQLELGCARRLAERGSDHWVGVLQRELEIVREARAQLRRLVGRYDGMSPVLATELDSALGQSG